MTKLPSPEKKLCTILNFNIYRRQRTVIVLVTVNYDNCNMIKNSTVTQVAKLYRPIPLPWHREDDRPGGAEGHQRQGQRQDLLRHQRRLLHHQVGSSSLYLSWFW